jgi:hypothetical protein
LCGRYCTVLLTPAACSKCRPGVHERKCAAPNGRVLPKRTIRRDTKDSGEPDHRCSQRNFAALNVACCTLRFRLCVQRRTLLGSAPAAISLGKGRALALKDRHGREASHGGRMVTPGYMQARLGRKGNGFNIPHETQFETPRKSIVSAAKSGS